MQPPLNCVTSGKSRDRPEPQFPLGITGTVATPPLQGKAQGSRSGLLWPRPAHSLTLSGPRVTPFVKEEAGFSQLDCPSEDFHGPCHLGNLGDRVSGLSPSLPPSLPSTHPLTTVGYGCQMCTHHLSGSRQVGRGFPLGRDHGLAPSCYHSWLGTKLVPLPGRWSGKQGNCWVSPGTPPGDQRSPIPTSLSLAALPLCGTGQGLLQAEGIPPLSRSPAPARTAPLLGEGWGSEGRFLPLLPAQAAGPKINH